MSGRTRETCFRLSLALLAVFSYYMAICQYRRLLQSLVTYQIVCDEKTGSSLTKADYENIREVQQKEEASLSYALWRKTDGFTAENPKWNRTSTVSVWMVRGSLEVLFHEFVKLQEQDLEGCYLDAKTAQELFGSTEVIGSQIVCNDRSFTIRGILQEETALVVIRPKESETTDRVTFENADGSEVSNFQMRYGIQGTAANDFFLQAILLVFLFLFPVRLIFCFSKRKGLRWLCFLCLICLFLHSIKIPETMIPDKWSNFQFWSDWWAAARENIAVYLQQEKTGRELARMACFGKGVVCAVLPVFFWRL